MQKISYTKQSYADAVNKHIVRDFMFSHFQLSRIVGLPGPDIQQYLEWCKSKGFNEIEAWEYEPLVAIKQLSELQSELHSYNIGDIINAELRADTLYDLDYCRTIKYMKNHMLKFKKNFIMTFSRRLKGFNPNMFFNMIGEKITSSKECNSPIAHTIYNTNNGRYIYAPYFDTSPMFSIAKIK